MELSQAGFDALQRREGKRNWAYPDPNSPLARAFPQVKWGYAPAASLVSADTLKNFSGNPWTCGIGQTGAGIDANTYWTDEEVYTRFRQALVKYVGAVNTAITVPTTQNEFDAMVSFAWNVGIAGFKSSSVIKAHNRNNKEAAARAFRLWNKPAIIIGRRKEEELQYSRQDVPEAVPPYSNPEPERSMAKSEINIAAGAGIVSTVAATTGQLLDIMEGKEVYFLAVIIIAILGYIIYQRVNQRKEGWA